MFRKLLALSIVVVPFALIGCGGGMKSVDGVVTLDSKPVEGAMVSFTNADNPGAPSAEGTTDASGKFTLSSRGKPGVPAGNYKATVTKTESKGPAPGAAMTPGSPEYVKMMQGMSKQGPPKSLVPDKYTKANTTPFTFKVPPDSSPLKLDMTSK